MRKQYLMFLVLPFLLMACAPAMYNVKPETPRQVYATASYQFDGMIQTAINLRERGVMDDETHAKVLVLFERTELTLDATKLLLQQHDGEGAEANLRLVNNMLWEIRDILMEVEGG
jgi:hypothetical protein